MKKLTIIILISTFGLGYSQVSSKVKTGGYLYSNPDSKASETIKYCSDGQVVSVFGRYNKDADYLVVEIDGFKGLMFYSAIKNSANIKNTTNFYTYSNDNFSKNNNIERKKVSKSQKVIQMKKLPSGTFEIDCRVNGLSLKFIFDTGASDVSISLTEAIFMIKNGYLSEKDIMGSQYYSIANGDIAEGTTIRIKELEFGGLTLYNVEASIVHELAAPLLLGQSAISRLGKIQLNPKNATLSIIE